LLKITLTEESDLVSQIAPLLTRIVAQVRALLPVAEIEHIGATAIPGALTKGDLDIMVRVPAAEFPHAIAQLKTSFSIKQPENWNDSFASFGEDTAYPLPLGVQLVARDSESDFFIFVRDYLIQNPDALTAYNKLKLDHAGQGAEAYWQAKNRFLSAILAARPH
jgi:GrpB-like predicted nucleotidyltransferase (UPF0157 family)